MDHTTYGGLTEIRGIISDLETLGCNVTLNADGLDEQDVIFLIPSGIMPKELAQSLSKTNRLKIQCITDLRLMYSNNQIGSCRYLSQVRGSNCYFPFEKYVVKYRKQYIESFPAWHRRKYRCIYGGGGRSNGRTRAFNKYLFENAGLIHKIGVKKKGNGFVSENKIPFEDLQIKYRKSMFGLVVVDDAYSAFGMHTQRMYEYVLAGCIPIFDADSSYLITQKYPYPIIDGLLEIHTLIQYSDLKFFNTMQVCNAKLIKDVQNEMEKSHRILERYLTYFLDVNAI